MSRLYLIFIVFLVSCSKTSSLEELYSLKCLNQDIIKNNELFIVTRSSFCPDCFQRILEEIDLIRNEKRIVYVILGNNYKEINDFANNFPDLVYFDDVDSDIDINIYPVIFIKKNETIKKYVINNPNELKNFVVNEE
ncbi:hypothetical protein [Maribellus maritimus]|uniref:hypothetical protein n=1 Tax=Maribellus maritimus TaxID=2870838 RepID=UPI001EEC4023|nr:hypothetical protein [Maribellus maritimus]MCG6188127.1 hypothetical protein [Maribellus maritimus]